MGFLARRPKTNEICADHTVLPSIVVKPSVNSDRAWVWNTGDTKLSEMFAIRFANAELAHAFKTEFQKAQDHMAAVL
eukprot:NODE_3870_length_395_cov_81.043353_g3431_i0.p2 GENE.NODE_3870_length_395_cov_81.043353_g3431_i0~~NODE_3870_length_395_cov_81.043353_g3431_i0.p2  ORF type:complete len:84 (+),score=18.25 NODE_3870_length_395_cov_81.043353_g3431_i0:22-252(+)